MFAGSSQNQVNLSCTVLSSWVCLLSLSVPCCLTPWSFPGSFPGSFPPLPDFCGFVFAVSSPLLHESDEDWIQTLGE